MTPSNKDKKHSGYNLPRDHHGMPAPKNLRDRDSDLVDRRPVEKDMKKSAWDRERELELEQDPVPGPFPGDVEDDEGDSEESDD